MGQNIRIRRKSHAIIWDTPPNPTITEGIASVSSMPVSIQATGVTLALTWKSPGAKPAWVSFSGTSMQFDGTQVPGDSVNNVVLTASATGVIPVDSPSFNLVVGAAPPSWTIPTGIQLTQGGAAYNLGVPTGLQPGGLFEVDSGGTALPTGVQLTPSGSLSALNTAALATTSGVKFAYTEPGLDASIILNPSVTNATAVPYMCAYYPDEGQVPLGAYVGSTDDLTMRSSILSRWPDNSAQVVVLAGYKTTTAGVPQTLRLELSALTGTALTTTEIQNALTTIVVDIPTVGSVTFNDTDFASPNRVWWANAATICARYIKTIGSSQMAAVVDVHAFTAGRAFVEVTVENSLINADATSPTAPTTQNYTGASISINGTVIISGVNSPTAGQAIPAEHSNVTMTGGHQRFCSWYASGWADDPVGPGILVTHDTVSMQRHKMFFKPIVPVTTNFTTKYANAKYTYTPFSLGFVNLPNMGQGGGAMGIGPFTELQCEYITTGSAFVAAKLLIETKQGMSCPLRWRDQTHKMAPHRSQMLGKKSDSSTSIWPTLLQTATNQSWEGAHQPSITGLLAFMIQPSPTFIEHGQGVFVWNHTNTTDTGFRLYGQGRGRAWKIRNYAHGIFLTPDSIVTDDGTWNMGAWKTGARTSCASMAAEFEQFYNPVPPVGNPLDLMWDTRSDEFDDKDSDPTNPLKNGFNCAMWFHQYAILGVKQVINGKVLRGTDATRMGLVYDWLCKQPVRWINDHPAGEGGWRFHNYTTSVAAMPSNLEGGTWQTPLPTWHGTNWADALAVPFGVGFTGRPPNSGPWQNNTWAAPGTIALGGENYVSYFWAGFVEAVERDITGASAAWDRVLTSVTNFSTWKTGFATLPHFGSYPRNKP